MFQDNIIGAFFFEFIPAMFALIFGLFLAGFLIFNVVYYTLDRPTCTAKAAKMGIETNWSYWTGCMVNLQGQWLSVSDVIPAERNGKIVFIPKPVFTIDGETK